MEENQPINNEEIINEQAEMNINSDSDIPGNNHLSNEDAVDPVEKLQTELDEQKDKYLRLFAEFDNYKKRSAKERFEYLQTAGKDVIVNMLDVLDDCDRAEKIINNTEDIVSVKEGFSLVINKLRSLLQNRGLKPMEATNENFDVDKHEAITEIFIPDMEGKVIEETSKGYLLNDKIIRFAKVVVGKAEA